MLLMLSLLLLLLVFFGISVVINKSAFYHILKGKKETLFITAVTKNIMSSVSGSAKCYALVCNLVIKVKKG